MSLGINLATLQERVQEYTIQERTPGFTEALTKAFGPLPIEVGLADCPKLAELRDAGFPEAHNLTDALNLGSGRMKIVKIW